MRLIVLGSSSSGNCYLLDGEEECLMIECGVPFKEVEKAVDFKIAKISGVLVSHEHSDHAGFVKNCIEARRVCYMSSGTMHALGLPINTTVQMVPAVTYRIGGFLVQPFHTEHDCAEPFGFYIAHKECGRVVFATDTRSMDYTFSGLNNIMIECNYMENILLENCSRGLIYKGRAERVRRAHLSLPSCISFLKANDITHVNNIVLIHLSNENAKADLFRQIIARETGKNVIVARKGLVADFNITPF